MKKILFLLLFVVIWFNCTAQVDTISAAQATTHKLIRQKLNETIVSNNLKAPLASPTITGTATTDSVVFTNGITSTSNAALTLNGDATVWDDLFFPFTTGSSGAGLYPPLVVDSLYYTFSVDSTGGTKCFEYFAIQMPHNYKLGSTIYPHVHYKQEDATTDIPTFIMKYKWYNLGSTTQKGWRWYKMGTSTGTTNNTHQLLYNATGISGTGITSVSSMLICQIYLYAAAAGNATCNAYQFDIHIEKDDLGSKTQLSK